MSQACPMCGTDREGSNVECKCGYNFSDSYSAPVDIAESGPKPVNDYSLLAVWGKLLIIAGIMLSAYAYVGYDPSVGSDGLYSSRIINNGLLQNQLMIFLAGLTTMLTGMIAYCTDLVICAIKASNPPS